MPFALSVSEVMIFQFFVVSAMAGFVFELNLLPPLRHLLIPLGLFSKYSFPSTRVVNDYSVAYNLPLLSILLSSIVASLLTQSTIRLGSVFLYLVCH